MKEVTFTELPQKLQDRVTGWASVEGDIYEVTHCELSGSDARCYIKSDGIIGLFDLYDGTIRSVWIGGNALESLCKSVSTASTMGKKGGSAKTEAKSSASRENGKKGGRPKKKDLSHLDHVCEGDPPF